MTRLTLALLLLASLFLYLPGARGDTIHMKNGGKFEGKLLRETATHYVFKTKFGEQTFKKSDVKKLEKGESDYDLYESKRKALSTDDAEAHYQLGLWCMEKKLRKEAKAMFRATLKADPDHAGAQDQLGFVKYEGNWIKKEKHRQILADIAKREGEILAGLKLDKTYRDRSARFSLRPPEGWEKKAEEGESVTFTGPELGKVPIVILLLVEDGEEEMDEAAETIKNDLTEEHEDLRVLGDPTDQKLGTMPAKLFGYAYTREDLAPETIPVERRELLALSAAGNFRLAIFCREGYFDRLRPFFDRVAGTVKLLDKPADVEVPEYGYGFAYPDDSYEKRDSLPVTVQGGGQAAEPKLPPGTVIVANKTVPMASIIVVAGKGKDGGVDASTLETLRSSLPDLYGNGDFIKIQGDGTKTTVGGAEALIGELKFKIPDGPEIGNGRWAVFKNGDFHYRCAFINIFNSMGARYVKDDFNKFLAGFRFIKPEK